MGRGCGLADGRDIEDERDRSQVEPPTGTRVNIRPPSTWTTALPHPSVEECTSSGGKHQAS